jgi:quaternary ammonium compound-resistance protein SugE
MAKCKKYTIVTFAHMNWLILILAGLFEVGFTTCLKFSNNFKHTGWSIGFFLCISLSFFLLNKAIQTIPIGTAYAVWTGIGAVGTAIMGIYFFKEPSDFWRLFFIATLIGSIIGLKWVSAS